MNVEFKDLEALAKADFNSPLSEVLAERVIQYQNASPEEILDFLEEAVETYAASAPKLSLPLIDIIQKEIEFFISVYENSLKRFPHIRKRDFLSNRVCKIADNILILNKPLHRQIHEIAS